jgi:uncharacterized peroxidase-related enzyme
MWIRTVDPDEASGVLAEAYDRQKRRLGEVTEFTQLGSLYPNLVDVRLNLYKVVDHCPSDLPEWLKHAVALTTSVLNRTPHCASGLGEKLTKTRMDPSLVEAIYSDPMGATTGDAAADAMLAYARKVVLRPWDVTEDDIGTLRTHGWSDLDILDANNICAYYCYINRVANGLGLKTPTCPAPELPPLEAVPAWR